VIEVSLCELIARGDGSRGASDCANLF
jgi:hypothetical protein